MYATMQKFIDELQRLEINYEIIDNEKAQGLIMRNYSEDNDFILVITYIFDENGEGVNIRAFSICKVKSVSEKLLEKINEINNTYRWICLFIDDDNISARCDAYLDENNAAQICFRYAVRLVTIIDEIYPQLMKLIWS